MNRNLPIIRICGILVPIIGLVVIKTSSSSVAMICAFLLGFLIFLPMTTFLTIPQQLRAMNARRLTVIMAMFWSITYIVETLLYTVITRMVNKSGFETAMYVAIGCSLTFLLFGSMLPETGKGAVLKAEEKERICTRG